MKPDKALWENLASFHEPEPLRRRGPIPPIPGQEPVQPTDAEPALLMPDGSVKLRLLGEPGAEIRVNCGIMSPYHFSGQMQQRPDGVYELTLPADERLRGNIILEFTVNGVEMVHPHLPVQVTGRHLVNCIEVPDPGTPYVSLKEIPHGTVSRELFYSETVGSWERCFVYTPPGLRGGEMLPVLYLQHGAGENETGWVFNGRLPYILDALLAEGKALPFLVVMNEGLQKIPGQTHINDFDGIEGILCRDCRQFIEARYPVRKDKWGRAIAGLSLGSMQAAYIGLRHPELYSAVGSFTYMRLRDRDNSFEGNPHLDALKDPARFWTDYRLLFRSIGGAEMHLHEFEADGDFIHACGADRDPGYVTHIYPGMTHDFNCWRRALYDFAQLLFRW